MSLLLGIELSGPRAVLTVVDRKAAVLAAIEEDLETPVDQWWTANPEQYVRTVLTLLERSAREGIVRSGQVAAIGLAVDHGIVVLDPEMKVVSPRDIPWGEVIPEDGFQLARDLEQLGETAPRVLARAGLVFSLLDFLRFRLTGALATHESFAYQTGWLVDHRRRDDRDRARAESLGLRPDALPPIFPAGWRVGTVSEEVVERSGIQRGVWVAAGSDPLSAELLVTVEPVKGTGVLRFGGDRSPSAWRVGGPPENYDRRALPLPIPAAAASYQDLWYHPVDPAPGDPRGRSWTAPEGQQWTLDSRDAQRATDWETPPGGDTWFAWDLGGPSAGAGVLAGLALGWWRDLRSLWRKGRAPVAFEDWNPSLEGPEAS